MVNFLSHCTLLYFLAAKQKKRPCSTGGGGIWWILATYWSLWFLIFSIWRDSFDRFSPTAAANRENSAKSVGDDFRRFLNQPRFKRCKFFYCNNSAKFSETFVLNWILSESLRWTNKNRENNLDFNGLTHHQERGTPSVIGDLLVWQVKPGKTSISPTLTSIFPIWACFYFASIGHKKNYERLLSRSKGCAKNTCCCWQ